MLGNINADVWNERDRVVPTHWMPLPIPPTPTTGGGAPRGGTYLALQANTSFGLFSDANAPEVRVAHWEPLDGLVRNPLARCARCGARHIEHDLEPVGFTCPDREGVFQPDGGVS